MMNQPKPWKIIYAAAILCDLISIALIYNVTVTGDTSTEWVVWFLVILGFGLIAYGWLTESKYKRLHPEEFPPEAKPPKKK